MKKSTIRHLKTLGLALFAISTFVWACIYSLEIPQNIVESYLWNSFLMLLILVALAFLTVGMSRAFKVFFTNVSFKDKDK